MGKFAKALVGAAVAGLIALKVGVRDGLTLEEGIEAAIGFLGGLGAVWATPNSPTVSTSTVRQPGEPTTTIKTETE